MEIIRNVRMMRQTARTNRSQDRSTGFVPTMGALHEGHLSLVRRARDENDVTVVSIFVNPTQFGPSEDFNQYPRDIEGDMEKLEAEGVDILFLPEKKDIYPEGYSTYVIVEGLSDRLCGLFREGHFRGVATVVTKLFNIVSPDRAYFGQKDYQQAQIIKRLTTDLDFDIEVVVCPIVREEDGLAMSSRNRYLSPEERKAAPVIYRVLRMGAEGLKKGLSPSEVRKMMWEEMKREPLVREIQYLSVYHPESLEDLTGGDVIIEKGETVLIATAVRMDRARLIDNILVDL